MKLTAAQREQIPAWSLAHNGWGDGSGYPGKANNPACKYVGHGLEYSCADGVTTTFGKAGFPLVSMQPGMAEGYAYCPDAYLEGKKRGAVINSWACQIGDILLINTGGGAQPGHTEVVYDIQGAGATRRIYSIGWDSGPSNVDHYTGQGGTHKHVWSTPVGKGNAAIYAVLDADKVIDWAKVGHPDHTPAKAKRKKLLPAPQHKTEHSKVVKPPAHVPTHRKGKPMTNPATKPGVTTSEFWAHLITQVVAILGLVGQFNTTSPLGNALIKIAALVASAGAAAGYANARGKAKAPKTT